MAVEATRACRIRSLMALRPCLPLLAEPSANEVGRATLGIRRQALDPYRMAVLKPNGMGPNVENVDECTELALALHRSRPRQRVQR